MRNQMNHMMPFMYISNATNNMHVHENKKYIHSNNILNSFPYVSPIYF